MILRQTLIACIAGVAVVLAAGCSESQFGGAAKKQDKKEEAAGDEDDGSDGFSSEPADDPAMVAGAYLTCTTDPALAVTADTDVGVGCVVNDKDGKKYEFKADENVKEWTVFNQFNFKQDVAFTAADAASPYHATAVIPKANVAGLRVQANIEKTGVDGTQALVAEIKSPGLEAETTATETVIGLENDFKVGDGSAVLSENFDCGFKMQQLRFVAAAMKISFQVSGTEAPLAITLDEMCGSRYGSNVVELYRDSALIWKQSIPPYSKVVPLAGLKAVPGSYVLRIVSNPRIDYPTDRDDFIVGRVVFTSTATLDIKDPLPE
jgi:hypothetical protein